MAVFLLLGDDFTTIRRRRSELLSGSGADGGSVQRFDLSEADAAARFRTALDTRPMFGGPRYLEAHVDASFDDTLTDAIAAHAASGDTVVLHARTSPRPAQVTRLGATVEKLMLPRTGRGLEQAVRDAAFRHEVTLTPAQVTRISETCTGDPARAVGLIYTLSVLGEAAPDEATVAAHLNFGVPAAGAPWALVDHIASGDIGGALTLSDSLEPLHAWSVLSGKLGQIGRVVDSGYVGAEDVAAALGIASFTVASALHALATRLGPRGVAASWELVMRTDIELKRSVNPRATLDAALVELCLLWGASSSSGTSPALP